MIDYQDTSEQRIRVAKMLAQSRTQLLERRSEQCMKMREPIDNSTEGIQMGGCHSTEPLKAGNCVKRKENGRIHWWRESEMAPRRLRGGVTERNRSHGTSRLSSQPPSAPIRHRHGRPTRFILQTEKGYQTPI